jgi:ligand-binding sensor domain-containing protein
MERQRPLGYLVAVLALAGAILAVLVAPGVLAQPSRNPLRGTWRSHTCADCISAIAAGDDAIWAGTFSAGVLRLDRATGTFQRFTTTDGLDANGVRDVDIGPDGSVWVLTTRWALEPPAVSRWDGLGWTTYIQAPGMPDSPGTSLAGDRAGMVWIATAAGVGHFDGMAWHTYTSAHGLPADTVNAVAVGAGSVWVATTAGLAERVGTHFAVVPTGELPSPSIRALSAAADGSLWALVGERLAHYNPGGWPGGRWWIVYAPPGPFATGAASPTYVDLFQRPGGPVWVCCSSTRLLHTFDGQAWSSLDVAAATGLPWQGAAAITGDAELWIGTPNEGLAYRRSGVWRRAATGIAGPTNVVAFAITVDPFDQPWVGFMLLFNPDNLVNHFDGTVWQRHDSRESMLRAPRSAFGVAQNGIDAGADGTVWVAIDPDGVASRNGTSWTTWTVTDVIGASARIRAVTADDRGGAWVATSRGAAHFDAGSWHRYTTADGMPSNEVQSVGLDHRTMPDTVWFGTGNAGAVRWDGSVSGWRSFRASDGLGADAVADIAVDKDRGVVWFALGPNGGGPSIASYDGTVWRTFGHADGLVSDGAWDLAVAPDGAVWAALIREDPDFGPGVARFDGQQWAVYTTADGLVDDLTFGVAADSTGNIWIATRLGINEFTPDGGGYPAYPPPSQEPPVTATAPAPAPTGTSSATRTATPPPTTTGAPPARTPTPGGSPPAEACVCDFIRSRVPAAVVNDAVANPGRYAGWMQLRDPKKRESPYNPRRTCLTLERLSVPYNALHNPVIWKAGCP